MMQLFQTFEKRLALAQNGNPKRSVEELAAHVLGCRPLEIYSRQMTPAQAAALNALIVRAEQGEPIQYIVGNVDFRGLEILCDRRALIPRPETELLVDEVLKSIPDRSAPCRIADVCTGTGCVGLALAVELPAATVIGSDISPEALDLARENAERIGLSGRFLCLENNLLEGVGDASLNIVVSNPPYILSEVCKTLDRSVREYEPNLALDGGDEGLDLIRPLVDQTARVLKPGGGLFLEIGYDQGEAGSRCLESAGFKNVRIIRDYAGLNRIVMGILP